MDDPIDIVLGGHDHICKVEVVNGIHVIKSGSDFQYFSEIRLDFTQRTRVGCDATGVRELPFKLTCTLHEVNASASHRRAVMAAAAVQLSLCSCCGAPVAVRALGPGLVLVVLHPHRCLLCCTLLYSARCTAVPKDESMEALIASISSGLEAGKDEVRLARS
jgi:hypothetical protein